MEILNLGIDYGSEHPIYIEYPTFDDEGFVTFNIFSIDDDFEAFLFQNRDNIYDKDLYMVKECINKTVEFAKPLRIKDIHFEEHHIPEVRGNIRNGIGFSYIDAKWLVLKLGFQNADADENFGDILRLERFVRE